MKTPCYQCPERSETCHAECERYLAYRDGRLKVYEERKKKSIGPPRGAKWSPKVCP